MNIYLKDITVRELVAGYTDDGEGGVRGYSGKLDIRPPFQRQFVYAGKNEYKRDAVIDTLLKGFPLNTMYWAVRGDGTYEVIDGQQRTIAIAQFINRIFSFKGEYFDDRRDKFKDVLDYKLTVYFCEGTDDEKIEWFETINIAGSELTRQELRNAIYTGTWLIDAKRRFSKTFTETKCDADKRGGDYMKGDPLRQEYLETVIGWIIGSTKDEKIREYMSKHQYDPNANELWEYFESIIEWIEATFPEKRKDLMKGQDWGTLYNDYKDMFFDPVKVEEEIQELIFDDDVGNKRGIYHYILDRNETHLNLRAFDKKIKQKQYEIQEGICTRCGESFTMEEMEADHIDPWSEGGKTEIENCQMLCKPCNRRKSSK